LPRTRLGGAIAASTPAECVIPGYKSRSPRMGTWIQVRDVPVRCTERCKARAAREAVSLSEYLRTELHRVADCPTPDELLERFRSRKRVRTSETSASAFGPSATSRLDRRGRLRGPRCVARRRRAQRHRSMPFRLRRTPRPTAVALGAAPYPRGHHPHDRIRVLVRTARTSAKATKRNLATTRC
jgi:hypothetical protein